MTDKHYEAFGKLLGRIPKAGPSADFDKKFWARFEAGSPRKFPWFHGGALVGTGVLVLTSLIGFLFYVAVPEEPVVRLVHGSATVEKNNERSDAEFKRLKIGDTVRVEGSGWLVMEMGGAYAIKLHPGSELKISGLRRRILGGSSTFQLKKGEALVSIGQHTGTKYPLVVRTPTAFAKAMGTQFRVTASVADRPFSNVSVLEGRVEVLSLENKKKFVRVEGGYETNVEDGKAPDIPQEILSGPLKTLSELFGFDKEDQFLLLVSMGPNRTRELLKPCRFYIRMRSRTPEAEAFERIVTEIEEASDDGDLSKHFATAVKLERLLENDYFKEPVPALLFTAAYYAYLGQYEEAARLFGNIAFIYPRSEFASVALLAQAYLYDEKLNAPEKALKAAREILSTYPRSYESSEAQKLINKIS